MVVFLGIVCVHINSHATFSDPDHTTSLYPFNLNYKTSNIGDQNETFGDFQILWKLLVQKS